ncbi:DUF6685 family protein [Pseudomonas aeruginosa]
MRHFFLRMKRMIQDDLGFPASVRAVVEGSPGLKAILREPARSIAASSVVRWHEWGSAVHGSWPRLAAGEMLGWRSQGGQYGSFHLTRDDLASLGTREIKDQWQCEIQDVVGLSASKSELRSFVSLDDMVATNSRPMIEPVSLEKLEQNLAWSEIRILHRDDPSDHFACYRWDGRLFLMNSGGSHHFAAARYIASRLSRAVPLQGQLRIYGLNSASVASLVRDFEIFVLRDEASCYMAFHDAMRAYGATYLERRLPRPYDDCRAVFMPRDEARAARAAAVLRECGFYDVGDHLQELACRSSPAFKLN